MVWGGGGAVIGVLNLGTYATVYMADAGGRTCRQYTMISNIRFGSLVLRLISMRFPAMLIPDPGSKINSDNQLETFLLILVWHCNHIFCNY